jgi:RimJ/RimL family protein N-acetyltransferase
VRHDLVLTGHGVRLVAPAPEHAPALFALIDDALWAGMVTPPPRDVDRIVRSVEAALDAPDRWPFVVLDDATGEVRGQTSLYDVSFPQERCEIGHTYYGRRWWGGPTNPACKLLLLTHAFETWGMHRVALRADARNTRSMGAITRLGAVPEGVLRGHRIASDGTRGDTAYFSILRPEWPAVRAGLEERLAGA